MKNILFIFAGLSLLFFCKGSYCNEKTDDTIIDNHRIYQGNGINIMCSQDLQSLASNWATEYGKLFPSVKISISYIDNQRPIAENTFLFVSDGDAEKRFDEANWKIPVGRNVIVPIISSRNPFHNVICQQGISAEEISVLVSNAEHHNWEGIISGVGNIPVQYYILDNESVKSGISNFIKTEIVFSSDNLVESGSELLQAIEKDEYAIGFCRLADITDENTNKILSGIELFPIDKNKNGRVDNFENIYENLQAFTRGVWIGKYPVDLSGNIYISATEKPSSTEALAFLTWIIGDGQQLLGSNGFCSITNIEKGKNIFALTNQEVLADEEAKPITAGVWVLIVAAFIVVGFVVTIVVKSLKIRKENPLFESIEITQALDENSMKAPKGLYFDKTHTWAFMEKDGFVKVGIDDFLQHITGSLTINKMLSIGEKVRRGEKIFTINHKGKQLDIYSPVSGIINEQNLTLVTDAGKINASPYSNGWVYSIEPINWLRETQLMFMADKYKDWLKNEFSRLRDFFAMAVRSNNLVYSHIVLQDGGEIADNVLADLGPEVWEEFQYKFINTSK